VVDLGLGLVRTLRTAIGVKSSPSADPSRVTLQTCVEDAEKVVRAEKVPVERGDSLKFTSLRGSVERHDPELDMNSRTSLFVRSEKRLLLGVMAGFMTELRTSSWTAPKLWAIS
jgi:hypothetical protein